MVKALLFVLLIAFEQSPQVANMKLVRSLYAKSVDSEESLLKLEKYLGSVKQTSLVKGYRGSLKMMKAKYVISPIQKLSNFKNGKAELEIAIKESPKDVELIYLRYAIQSVVPAFLNYNSSLKTDKRFLLTSISEGKIHDKELRGNIVDFLRVHGKLTDLEQAEIRKDL